jgi:CelD/BcsL family acetyltransferase involved in cellulose biosynthesis
VHGLPAKISPLLDLRVTDGIDPAADEAAAHADPRHRFLRRAWFEAAGGEGARTLVAARPDGQVVVALPTVNAAPFVRAVPGSYWPIRSFPIAADASDEEVRALLASPLAKQGLGRAFRIGPANADDPTLERLARAAPAAGWTILQRRIATSFTMNVAEARASGSWPRSSTLKKNRWHERQLALGGALEWRFVSGADWTPLLFDALAAIERNSWVGEESGTNPKFLDSGTRAIWEKAARDPQIAAMMHAGLLVIGGVPAAFSFGIEAGRTRYCIATSYDQAFARHSPGKLLAYRTYVDAAERGIAILDDGAGDGGHKSTLGEAPGPDIIDVLLVRGMSAAALLRPLWERSAR